MEERLFSIKRFWRAANYVSCVLLYLRENVLLRHTLQPEHFKSDIVGHWGACPGINAIASHLYSKVKELQIDLRLVMGTGHAGPSLAAILFLDGSFNNISTKYSTDESGLRRLANEFGASGGIATEISPDYPGVQYCGGELGGALAFGQGYVLNKPQKMVACIIGDGELETALTHSAWQGYRILSKMDGAVLPIINANGYRQGSRSLFSLLKSSDVDNFFFAHNLSPYWACDHYSLAIALDRAFAEILSPTIDCQLHPVVIFQSPKGWTAPEELGGERYVDTYKAHKPVLRNPESSAVELEQVRDWLASYEPSTLFDINGKLLDDVAEILPAPDLRFGVERELCVQKQSCYIRAGHSSINLDKSGRSPIEEICDKLSDLMLQEEYRDILIFSPDELISNGFAKILERTKLRYCYKYDELIPPFSPDGRVIEVLNEQLCFGWLQGYCMSGGHGIFICYEAFATICDSQVAQFLKYLDRMKIGQRSVNIVLTSLGWENNPSHQNPGFIDALLGRQLDNLRVYTPALASEAARILEDCLSSYNRLNVIVAGKHRRKLLSSIRAVETSGLSWSLLERGNNNYAVLVAIGDGMAEQCLIASNRFYEETGERTSVFALNELTLLERSSFERRAVLEYLEKHPAVIWAYLGYPASIKAMLWDNVSSEKHIILGYRNKGLSRPGQERYDENLVGADSIVYNLRKYIP